MDFLARPFLGKRLHVDEETPRLVGPEGRVLPETRHVLTVIRDACYGVDTESLGQIDPMTGEMVMDIHETVIEGPDEPC